VFEVKLGDKVPTERARFCKEALLLVLRIAVIVYVFVVLPFSDVTKTSIVLLPVFNASEPEAAPLATVA
jgi:hypothetical protein